MVSEFNPLNEERLGPEGSNKDQNALEQVLVNNFLKTQNMLSLASNGKLTTAAQELKSVPSSPGGAGGLNVRSKSRQLQLNMNGPQQSTARSRRLASSMSSTNFPELRKQNDFAPSAAYNTAKQSVDAKNTAEMMVNAEQQEAGAERVDTKQQSASELAKIQPTSALSIEHDMLVTQCESQPRTELVVKFVDFSSKYGLGYMLSNGSYGVLFNDSTKIILHPNLFHFDYIERPKQQPVLNSKGQATESVTDQVSHFDFFNYPESINKKVVLLQHFKSYLDGNQKFKPLEFNYTKENAPRRQEIDNEKLVYIKKWKRAKKAILLRNTNKIIQVMFQDLSELILCSGSGMVTFVNSK